ncbi:MAG: sodium-dependent transporter [Clostridia bacterium]|nr:sodium-dependent transporter [Clostridia bacterium]MBQ7051379.1 sodium-dependent transporter [Clostridia bacterium]
MENNQRRGSFSGSLGFVLAAAGSAVGLGNIWRFPYLAAKDGGGLFLLCYLVLALTFGFTLLTTEIAIGRKTGKSPLVAYRELDKRFGWLGAAASIIPVIILPYYCVIGGWVLKYMFGFITGGGLEAAADGYFTGFITAQWSPVIWFAIFLAATLFVVYKGVDNGIERLSSILMPILLLLIVGIAVFSLTLEHTDAEGVTRSGMEGLKVYLIPNLAGITLGKFMIVLMDALGQLFYSVSVAMGIMITYGSYVKKDTNLVKSVNQIEIFDTLVAFLAGMMIVPAVYTFMGTEGMAAGPSLMFISLPKVFEAMGAVGSFVGVVFFVMVAFAALTSSVSIMEAVVSCVVDKMHMRREKAALLVTAAAFVIGLAVCFGYNIFYFELTLPNHTVGQVLDVLDYVSNFVLMPVVAIATCVLIGWVIKPEGIIREVTINGEHFRRKKLYVVMVRFVAPALLVLLLLQSLGLLNL